MIDIAILGAGVMGSAMAVPAGALKRRVALVGTHLDDAIIGAVQSDGRHPRLGVVLPESVSAHAWTEFGAVMAQRPRLLILGVASAGVEWAIERIAESAQAPLPVLMITKGLLAVGDGIEVLPHVVRREVKRRRGFDIPVMAVGGPCIAGELAATRDTSVVVSGGGPGDIDNVFELLGADFYHARRSEDLTGVEVCAAFKNFYALAVGWANGNRERRGPGSNGALMHNVAAGLFTQAITEMEILVAALGGQRATVAGLAGAGDLYVTCLAGRNSRMGRLLGLGEAYSEAKAKHMPNDTVEGAELAKALGPTLRRMVASGRLPGERLPLLTAIVDAVLDDRPLTIDWRRCWRA